MMLRKKLYQMMYGKIIHRLLLRQNIYLEDISCVSFFICMKSCNVYIFRGVFFMVVRINHIAVPLIVYFHDYIIFHYMNNYSF